LDILSPLLERPPFVATRNIFSDFMPSFIS
jgi:hypothetical protein